ncbi:hypothetical protein [Enterocloster citroniae]|uniref:hypothetical protein n=2 Tax=Bacillota TaxID=1239 RepID=UPI002E75CF56|nr:hypothetical protein [Enterocloster citroniae]
MSIGRGNKLIERKEQMCERVKVSDAAKELGMSKQAVREHMRRGLFDIGDYIPKEKTGKKQDEFHIYRPKLDKHIGKVNIDLQ